MAPDEEQPENKSQNSSQEKRWQSSNGIKPDLLWRSIWLDCYPVSLFRDLLVKFYFWLFFFSWFKLVFLDYDFFDLDLKSIMKNDLVLIILCAHLYLLILTYLLLFFVSPLRTYQDICCEPMWLRRDSIDPCIKTTQNKPITPSSFGYSDEVTKRT